MVSSSDPHRHHRDSGSFDLVLFSISRWSYRVSVRQRWAYGLLCVGIAIGLISGFFLSLPWYLLSSLLFFTAWHIGRSDETPWPKIAGHCGLLALVFPWPNGLFDVIHSALQKGSATILSTILDGLEVFHIQSNNLVELAGQRFAVDDRLHGIDGLLPLMLLAALLGVFFHRSFSQTVMSMAFAMVWLVIGYVSFGLIAVFAKQWYEWDILADGSMRYGLAVAVFALQVVLIILQDRAMSHLFTRVATRSISSDTAITPVLLNGFLNWPQEELEIETSADSEGSEVAQSAPAVPEEPESLVEEEYVAPSDWNWKPAYWWAAGPQIALVAIGLLVFVVLVKRQWAAGPLKLNNEIVLRLPDKNSLPASLPPMQFNGYREVDSQPDDLNAPIRRSWRYQQPTQSGTITLMYPLTPQQLWSWKIEELGWNPLSTEYSGANKKVKDENDSWSWMLQHGDGETEGNAYVWRCGLKENFSPLRHKMATTLTERVSDRIGTNVLSELLFPESLEPLIGVQVMLESGDPLTSAEMKESMEWFFSARKILREAIEKAPNVSKSGEPSNASSN